MEENEILVKIYLSKNNQINQELYMDIINGLNDRFIPCNEISVNGEIVFTNTQGFTRKNKGVNNNDNI